MKSVVSPLAIATLLGTLILVPTLQSHVAVPLLQTEKRASANQSTKLKEVKATNEASTKKKEPSKVKEKPRKTPTSKSATKTQFTWNGDTVRFWKGLNDPVGSAQKNVKDSDYYLLEQLRAEIESLMSQYKMLLNKTNELENAVLELDLKRQEIRHLSAALDTPEKRQEMEMKLLDNHQLRVVARAGIELVQKQVATTKLKIEMTRAMLAKAGQKLGRS